jgi:hypothetical protein
VDAAPRGAGDPRGARLRWPPRGAGGRLRTRSSPPAVGARIRGRELGPPGAGAGALSPCGADRPWLRHRDGAHPGRPHRCLPLSRRRTARRPSRRARFHHRRDRLRPDRSRRTDPHRSRGGLRDLEGERPAVGSARTCLEEDLARARAHAWSPSCLEAPRISKTRWQDSPGSASARRAAHPPGDLSLLSHPEPEPARAAAPHRHPGDRGNGSSPTRGPPRGSPPARPAAALAGWLRGRGPPGS